MLGSATILIWWRLSMICYTIILVSENGWTGVTLQTYSKLPPL